MCRCSGASSPGFRYWIAAHSVGVANGRAAEARVGQRDRAALAAATDRHEVARPASASGSRSAHRHRCGDGARARVRRHQVADLGPQRDQQLLLEAAVELLELGVRAGWPGAVDGRRLDGEMVWCQAHCRAAAMQTNLLLCRRTRILED